MSRIILLVFLVFLLPAAIYWGGHRFEPAHESVGRFTGEFRELWGIRPEPTPTTPPREKPPKPEPEEPTDPEPEPPTEPEPEPEPTPPPPPEDPLVEAGRLFSAGRFEEAEHAYTNRDELYAALSSLGAAFAAAFPPSVPSLPYLKVRTVTGERYEGFASESGGLVTLRQPGGRQESLPRNVIAQRTTLEREQALDAIAESVRTEGSKPSVTGTRLFALVQQAFAAGRPAAAAPLLEELLRIDEKDPFILSSVRNRVDVEHQARLYRAFAACQVPSVSFAEEEPETPEQPAVARTPHSLKGTKRFDGWGGRTRSKVRSEKARALIKQASPLRKQGHDLYRRLYATPLAEVDLNEIDEAVGLLEQAATLYEQAMMIEDADEIAALLQHCSKLCYQLRFWKQQAEGR